MSTLSVSVNRILRSRLMKIKGKCHRFAELNEGTTMKVGSLNLATSRSVVLLVVVKMNDPSLVTV